MINLIEGSNVYIQDATGAIVVRTSSAPEGVQVGDTITATGTRGDYNGLPQLNNSTFANAETAIAPFAPKELTLTTLTTDDLCKVIKLSGLEVIEVFDNNGAYSTPNITVTDGANEIQIYKAIVGKTDGAWDVKVGDTIDVTAVLSYFKKFQLRNGAASDIVVVQKDSQEETTTTTVATTTTTTTTAATTTAGGTVVTVPPYGDTVDFAGVAAVMVLALTGMVALVIGNKKRV